MTDFKSIVDELLAAALDWRDGEDIQRFGVDEVGARLCDAVDAYRAGVESMQRPGPRTDQARPMTWGTVPAGWYVKAPDGQWYRVVQTVSPVHTMQRVTLDIAGSHREWDRAADGPVTACPGPPNATDDALKALGFPPILEDGS